MPALPVSDLSVSSLELDSLTTPNNALLPPSSSNLVSRSALEPVLQPRSAMSTSPVRGAGSVPASSINMKGVQAVFALIGASFVLGAIWFFFWAKNGGFRWKKGDWEEYKSTVLRRKGPDGRTLSNATKSTKLGGGSVVGRGYSDHDDQSTTLGMSEVAPSTVPEKMRKVKNKVKNKARRTKPGETYTESPKVAKQRAQREEKWEGGADEEVRAYRHEKPARVGGINKVADGTYYGTEYDSATNDGSAYGYYNHSNHSHDHSRRASRQASPNKRNSTRDFSYTAGTEETFSTVSDNSQRPLRHSYQPQQHRSSRQSSPVKGPGMAHGARRGERTMPGGYTEPYNMGSVDGSSDTGTKSYHHPIPGLGRNGGGFRRGGGGLSDSE